MRASSDQGHRGFSLTELAVVLGVIGLVLGGIWVAVDAVQERARHDTLKQQIHSLVAGLRSVYMGRSAVNEPAISVWNIFKDTGGVYTLESKASDISGELEVVRDMQRRVVGTSFSANMKTDVMQYNGHAASTLDDAATAIMALDSPWGEESDSGDDDKQKVAGVGSLSACAPYLPTGGGAYFATCYPYAGYDGTTAVTFTPQPYIGIQVLVWTQERCVGVVTNNIGYKAATGFVAAYLNGAQIAMPPTMSTLTTDCSKSYNFGTGVAAGAGTIGYAAPAIIMLIYKLKPS